MRNRELAGFTTNLTMMLACALASCVVWYINTMCFNISLFTERKLYFFYNTFHNTGFISKKFILCLWISVIFYIFSFFCSVTFDKWRDVQAVLLTYYGLNSKCIKTSHVQCFRLDHFGRKKTHQNIVNSSAFTFHTNSGSTPLDFSFGGKLTKEDMVY